MALVIGLASFLFLLLIPLMVVLMVAARLRPMPQPLDIPAAYLPAALNCEAPSGDYAPRCYTDLMGHYVYFQFQWLEGQQTIVRVVDSSRQFTLGELIAAWGTPTSLIWGDHAQISVFWGMRSALLHVDTPQPDSPVSFILYDLEQHGTSPWRGFHIHRKR